MGLMLALEDWSTWQSLIMLLEEKYNILNLLNYNLFNTFFFLSETKIQIQIRDLDSLNIPKNSDLFLENRNALCQFGCVFWPTLRK